MDNRDTIEKYKKELEEFLSTLGIFKSTVIVNRDKKNYEENAQFIKKMYIRMKSGNVDIKLLDIAINELIPYLS
ncbi:MAG: hypothetical protein K5765_06455 [Clostridia bacterium]|nr:hypothetical protein [Clostridia bacterium]